MPHSAVDVYLASLDSQSSRNKMSQILSAFSPVPTTPAELSQARASLVEKRLSPNTINLRLSALRGVQKARWVLGEIDAEELARLNHAAQNVKGERLTPGRHLDPDEIALLLEAAEHPRDKAIITLLWATGMRREELVSLDLDSLTHHGTTPSVRIIGKGNREREVPCEAAQQALNEWINLRGTEPGPLFTRLNRAGNPTLKRLATSSLWAIIKSLADEAGVQDISTHDLRRTAAGDFLDVADITTVQKLLGHQSIETTSRYDRRPMDRIIEAARQARPAA